MSPYCGVCGQPTDTGGNCAMHPMTSYHDTGWAEPKEHECSSPTCKYIPTKKPESLEELVNYVDDDHPAFVLEMARRLRALDELHSDTDELHSATNECRACRAVNLAAPWPCPTRRILDGEV